MSESTTTPASSNDPSGTDAADIPFTRSALDFPVVGLGASAGGLQALLRFFENAPADMDMAFVVVLHLSPKHISTADEILQRATRMRVVQVGKPVPIERNHVYVIAPGKSLTMDDGHLTVSDAAPAGSRPVTIDLFFRSLAEAHGPHATSIVLSGTGSDGAVGLARVKELGGVTFAQEPDDAEYGEMPQSAIATGQVDLVLAVVEMPQKLLELWQNVKRISLPRLVPRASHQTRGPEPEAGTDAESALQDILTTLRARTGHDFRHYKRATMLRRIERRLQVNALPDLVTYRDFLQDNPRETSALLADMLIGVTHFFRDREAFDTLARDVLPEICERRHGAEQVRVWVAGCSSGEEAYTVTMLLAEHQGNARAPAALQVFATDIDESAVAKARAGVYPDSIAIDVPPDTLRQFFKKSASRYEVVKPVREKILFALHNVLRDPPFSHLDLVSCRNLLIYLDRTVQRQVLEMFHFALYPNGFLMLGSSESADSAEDLFSVVDKKHRIYRAKVVAQPRGPSIIAHLPGSANTEHATEGNGSALIPARRNFSFSALHQRVLEQYAPPSIIVNGDSKIVHMSDNVGRFLRYVGGEPSSNVIALVSPELRLDLRTALFQAQQIGHSVDARRVRVERDGRQVYVTMTVRPFHDAEADADFVLVLFDEVQESMSDGIVHIDANADSVLMQLESELHRSKEQLQRTIEQYETSTEELKASNEELQAINEELRSATEELETSKEELQSVNEELITVNSELQLKIEETGKANDDLQNLIASSDIATIFVDREMRVKRYTPSATSVFNLIKADVGRSLFDITHRLHYPELADDVAKTFQSLRLIEREVSSNDARCFLARLVPYRTVDDRIDGAVLTLIDITARRRAEDDARTGEERLRLAVQTTNDYVIIVQDPEGVIQSWNAGAERVFGHAAREAVGRNIEMIYTAEDRAAGMAGEERAAALRDGRAEDERWHVAKNGRRVFCSGVVTPLGATFTGFAKIARDLTNRKTLEDMRQLQLSQERSVRERAEAANRLKDDFLAVLSHELKHPLNLINVKAEMLPRLPEARGVPTIVEAADAIRRAVLGQAQIIDDLLDLSRVRTGKLTLNLARSDLCVTIASICDAMEGDAAARGIALTIALPLEPAMARVDPVRFDQIVWNLLSNALKFTPPGGKVHVALTRDGAYWRIDVSDTGEGIEPHFLPHIFDMFSQANEARRKSGVGLGIGLALVKQLAEMHAGRVAASSEGADKGSCITVWLPPSGDDIAVPGVLPGESSVLAGLSILVIDDDRETGHALASLLTLEGASVKTGESGADALVALKSGDVDLLLCDVGMPVMDGYQLMQVVRALPELAALPSIALTGYSGALQERKTLDAGFDVHLTKPVSLAALVAAVERTVVKRRSV